jgi:hypothetical protein
LGAPVGTQMGWLAAELQAALAAFDHPQAEIVDLSYPDAYLALARGEIDMVANQAELVSISEQRAGIPLRAIPVGPDVYASSVLAADSVSDEIVERMTAAVIASFERQREVPDRGVDELRSKYPEVDRDVAVATWTRLEPYVFGGPGVGRMDSAGWERTLAWVVRTHGLPAALLGERVDRPLAPARVR